MPPEATEGVSERAGVTAELRMPFYSANAGPLLSRVNLFCLPDNVTMIDKEKLVLVLDLTREYL